MRTSPSQRKGAIPGKARGSKEKQAVRIGIPLRCGKCLRSPSQTTPLSASQSSVSSTKPTLVLLLCLFHRDRVCHNRPAEQPKGGRLCSTRRFGSLMILMRGYFLKPFKVRMTEVGKPLPLLPFLKKNEKKEIHTFDKVLC